MDKTIVMAMYRFGIGSETDEYPVIGETDKNYIIMKGDKKSRISKTKVGETLYYPAFSLSHASYIQVYLYDAAVSDAIEKIAEWFENEAESIHKQL